MGNSTGVYSDRWEAGQECLALIKQLGLKNPLVLAVPRGGVVTALPIAQDLKADLDVIVVRKLGAPSNPELAIGAVGSGGEPILNHQVLEALRVPREYLHKEIELQRTESLRREELYRTGKQKDSTNRDVVVVDDGIATGVTVEAAASLIRRNRPGRLVLAVPVAPRQSVERLKQSYDEVICPLIPEEFVAVGQWYESFRQVTDSQVKEALAQASRD